jgi:hypothetical protein
MPDTLVIHLDYKKVINRLKSVKAAKSMVPTRPNFPYYEDVGWIGLEYEFRSLGREADQVNITLNGEGPFYEIDNRVLKALEVHGLIRPRQPGKIGSIIRLNELRLKIVDISSFGELLVTFPDSWAVLFWFTSPIFRLIDLIYRRLIMTAAIWGFAELSPGVLPYWGHLKWFRKDRKQ